MSNAAIDYERMEALNAARTESSKADDFNVPKQGYSDDYFHVPQNGRADNCDQQMGQNENDEQNHAERLEKARAGAPNKSEAEKAKDLAKDAASLATPMGAFSLAKQIEFLRDIPYAAAFGAAILKDISDLTLIGSLPGLGTVLSVCASIFIFMMMLLVGAGERRKVAMGIIKKGGILFAGTVLEFIPGLNFVPVETFTVASIYFMTLSERKHSSQDQVETSESEDKEDEE